MSGAQHDALLAQILTGLSDIRREVRIPQDGKRTCKYIDMRVLRGTACRRSLIPFARCFD